MSLPDRARRWSARGAAATMALLAASAAAQAAVPAAQASRAAAAAADSSPVNPYAPAYHHPYRRGAVPTQAEAARMATWAHQHPGALAVSPAHAANVSHAVSAGSANNVSYGGGTGGIGVTTGDERVYLVFFGKQWGTRTVKNGISTFSHDPSGEAPYVQKLFKGLGTGSEQWSGLMTQYCEGVSPGAQTCPAAAPHVAYPHGGALAGVWYDNGAASPSQATGDQLGQAAIAAATHFGNTTAASNRDTSYIILSPTGTDPDGYKQQNFCAWHDYTGDSFLDGGGALDPSYIAFTNMPYVTNVGVNCGEHFVRTGKAGVLDGVSIVVGHEYAETITDQEPAGGWVDANGQEVADKCAWRQSGLGKVALLTLPTGTFAMQGSWANNANSGKGGCRFSQTIKTTQLLQNPGFEAGTLPPWAGNPVTVLQPSSTADPSHSGGWLALLGGSTTPATSTLSQQATVGPTDGKYGAATFSFWLEIKTTEPAGKAHDTLKVQELTTGGTVIKTLATFSNLNAVGHYVQHSFALAPSSFNGQPGQAIVLKFTGTDTMSGKTTSFLIDDTALKAS